MSSRLAAFGFLLLLVLAGFVPSVAMAADIAPCRTTDNPVCTREQAYTKALADVTVARCTAQPAILLEAMVRDVNPQRYESGAHCKRTTDNFIYDSWTGRTWFYGNCPAGTTWDETTKTCFNSQQCLAKNDALGSAIATTQGSTNGCQGGCAMSMGATYETRTVSQGALTRTIFRGQMRYTGQSCAGPPTKAPDSPDPECVQMTGTQTICIKPNGEYCAKGSNGRLACFRPGETGEKTDGPDKHVRQAGPTHTPPNLQLPNGDTLVQTGPPVVDQSTGKPGPTYNGPVTNNTTNTASYTTQQGTNAGPTNEGENGNGDGGGKEDDGEDEGKDGPKLSGGDNCNVPPVCDVVDDAACKSGIIQWKFQCDGSAEVGSAQDQAQTAVDLLNATWDQEEQQFSDGAIQRYNEVRATLAEDVQQADEIGLDVLDSSGFLGGGQCPQIAPLSVAGATIPFDFGPICGLFGSLGLLVEALAYIVALRIITRS
jgi:hypothetical protein